MKYHWARKNDTLFLQIKSCLLIDVKQYTTIKSYALPLPSLSILVYDLIFSISQSQIK